MCNCLEVIDQRLKEAGKPFLLKRIYGVNDAELDLRVSLGVATEMTHNTPGGRAKAGPLINATFCPFCGKEWAAVKKEPLGKKG